MFVEGFKLLIVKSNFLDLKKFLVSGNGIWNFNLRYGLIRMRSFLLKKKKSKLFLRNFS